MFEWVECVLGLTCHVLVSGSLHLHCCRCLPQTLPTWPSQSRVSVTEPLRCWVCCWTAGLQVGPKGAGGRQKKLSAAVPARLPPLSRHLQAAREGHSRGRMPLVRGKRVARALSRDVSSHWSCATQGCRAVHSAAVHSAAAARPRCCRPRPTAVPPGLASTLLRWPPPAVWPLPGSPATGSAGHVCRPAADAAVARPPTDTHAPTPLGGHRRTLPTISPFFG